MNASQEPIRVLHVDDDPAFAELTAAFLERESDRISVEIATDVDEGLDCLADTDVDCVVSDYEMPGTDGIEFLESVRESDPTLPFILFTGKGSEAVAADAVAADVSGYLQKGDTETFKLLRSRIENEVEDHRVSTGYREYETVVESLTDPVYVLDEEGRFTRVNGAFLELTGYDESTVIGSDPSLIKSPETLERAEKHLGEILSADAPDGTLIEIEIETADGRTVPCEDHIGVIPFEGERFDGSVGVLRDISDRRRAETYRHKLYDLMESADADLDETVREILTLGCERLGTADGKFVRTDSETNTHETIVTAFDTTQDGRIADLSKTYCRRVVNTGSTAAFHDAAASGWDDDPAVAEYGHACYAGAEVTADGEQYGTVCFFGPEPRSDGFSDAELTFVEMIARAVSQLLERRQATERAERRTETLDRIHTIVSDPDRSHDERLHGLLELGRGVLGMKRAAVSRVSGDSYRFEAVSAPDDMVEAGDVLPLSKTGCEWTIVNGETQAAARFEGDKRYHDHPIRTEFGFECYIGALLYREGDERGTLCFLDPSSRDRSFSGWERTFVETTSQWIRYLLEERDQQAVVEAERDRLGEFASTVSHDLRGPLSVASGQLELAAGDCTCDAVADRHAEAEQALSRMKELIDDTLELPAEGRSIGPTEPTALDDAAETAWRTVGADTATFRTRGELPTIEADSDQLGQLLETLFRNSVQHGGSDATVELGAIEGPAPGFYVTNDGPGLAESGCAGPFEYGGTSTDGGTGVGLAIVDRIADAHGWEVSTVERADGARFDITGVETVD